jgi:hypothetical protein
MHICRFDSAAARNTRQEEFSQHGEDGWRFFLLREKAAHWLRGLI